MDLVNILNKWTEKRINERLMHTYGGIQICPWCGQVMQRRGEWSFCEWDRDPMLDVFTCGPCGGTSLWRFEIGFTYIGPLDPPKPKHKPAPFYNIEEARLEHPDTPDSEVK